MLNKLLKRCMPWMDKGRWYKIVLVPSSGSYVIGNGTDPVFQNVNINFVNDSTGGYVSFDLTGTGIALVDIKIKMSVGSTVGYITSDFISTPAGTTIIIHRPVVIRPSDNISLEILAFGR